MQARQFGFHLPSGKKRETIAFEKVNNLIIIPITVNNTLTLKFVLDTGVKTPILTERIFADLLKLQYGRKITILSPGIMDSIQTNVVTGISFSLGQVKANDRSMLVLENDLLDLKKVLAKKFME